MYCMECLKPKDLRRSRVASADQDRFGSKYFELSLHELNVLFSVSAVQYLPLCHLPNINEIASWSKEEAMRILQRRI